MRQSFKSANLFALRRKLVFGETTAIGAIAVIGSKAFGQQPTQSQPATIAQTTAPASQSTGRLSGKVALITGAARGIGRACAVLMAQQGADIIACDIAQQIKTVPYPLSQMQDLQETARLVQAAGRRCLAVQADVRSREQMQDVVDRGIAQFGKIDILVANAGVLSYNTIEKATEAEWRDMFPRDTQPVQR